VCFVEEDSAPSGFASSRLLGDPPKPCGQAAPTGLVSPVAWVGKPLRVRQSPTEGDPPAALVSPPAALAHRAYAWSVYGGFARGACNWRATGMMFCRKMSCLHPTPWC